ncbi:hypothetical protein COBT_004059, partial [Conglomerata obtusa]
LKGRRFKLETDHKALERKKEKNEFNNDRVKRWIERIQQYDFEILVRKGEEMGLADKIKRGNTKEQVK